MSSNAFTVRFDPQKYSIVNLVVSSSTFRILLYLGETCGQLKEKITYS